MSGGRGDERPVPPPQPPPGAGLCPGCRHVRVVRSGKGSIFLLCGLSHEDEAFAKYPPQPVVSCPGFAR